MVSAVTTYNTTSIGAISISQVDPAAKFITLENTFNSTNSQDVNLKGWKLWRLVDGNKCCIYTFEDFTLKHGKSVKIFARGAAVDPGPNDLVFRDEFSWGIGTNITTYLINDSGQEEAKHIQTKVK